MGTGESTRFWLATPLLSAHTHGSTGAQRHRGERGRGHRGEWAGEQGQSLLEGSSTGESTRFWLATPLLSAHPHRGTGAQRRGERGHRGERDRAGREEEAVVCL